VRDALGAGREHLGVERGGRFRFPALPRHLRVLELVVGVARRAAHLLHGVGDHRHDDVIGHTPFTRAIVVQDVTKPKLALLHQRSRRIRWQGMSCERRSILTELSKPVQPCPDVGQPGADGIRRR
jgi:hypothetical protein